MDISLVSKSQKQLWLLNNMYPETGAYNLFSVFELGSNFDPEIFRNATQILLDRHESLRTFFKLKNDEIVQVISNNITITLPEIVIDENYKTGEVHHQIFLEVNAPFDLSDAPLFRFKLFRFENDISVLSLVFHHIIMDVRSESIFAKEIGDVYNSLLKNVKPTFDKPLFQYSDYVNEISSWYHSDDYLAKLADFIARYPDPNRKIEFPGVIPGSKNSSMNGSGIFFTFEDTLVNEINLFGGTHQINSYRVVLTAYAIFLHRLTNQDVITIGLPFSNRTRDVSKNTMGSFVNTLPLDVDFTKAKTVKEIFEQIDQQLKQNLNAQEIPFLDLVSKNPLNSSFDHNPYFQAGFAFKYPMQLTLNGVTAKPLKVLKQGAALDFVMLFWPENDTMVGYAEYSTDKFSADTINRWIGNFKVLLNNMLQNPMLFVDDICLLTENDIKAWTQFNFTDAVYDNHLCLHEKFEAQVKVYPDYPALKWGEEVLTYEQLNIQANRLAHFLIDSGIKTGDIIAFCLERGPELIVSILAIHKAGAAYLPFDIHAPADRIDSLIEDANPKCIITKKGNNANLLNNSISQILIDKLLVEPIHHKTFNPNQTVTSSDLAYIIYTSGSTGMPKGVKIEHHSVINEIAWMQSKYKLDSSDTLVLKTAVTFDASVWEIFWWYFNGSNLLILPLGGEKEPETIIAEVEKHQVTVLGIVPSMFGSFIAYLEALGQPDSLKSLKLIILGGEALSTQLVKDFNRLRSPKFNPCILNVYGPTEATVLVSSYECSRGQDVEKIFIGKPIFNTRLFIVNQSNKIQPVGVPGELLITGVNLSPGYLNRNELNIEKFVELTDNEGKVIRAYRSGDLAVLDKCGELDYLGRIDNQVKIRGYRIELGEIEAQIMTFSNITNSAVIVYEAKGANPQLVAYLTGNKNLDVVQLKAFLSSKLPDYMVPMQFVVLDEMPLTTSEKINRSALPKPIISEEGPVIAPQNEIEKTLMVVYKQLLNIEQIRVSSNFFEIGGSSILAPLVVVHLKKNYNISIKTLDIFEYPTIKGLAAHILGGTTKSSVVVQPPPRRTTDLNTNHDIAIIGMAGCFPGADNLDEYWNNIIEGKVTIKNYSRAELAAKGVSEILLNDPNYVYTSGIVDRGDLFDASFFEVTPREADYMDPQHRVFIEVCYEALEDAGYAKNETVRNIGVFAGAGSNSYLFKSLIQHPDALRDLGEFQTIINNEKDFLTTRVSYKFNLNGPSLNVQTGCSTSLVSLHIACQSLLNDECEMALAGGSYIQTPRGLGYMYRQGGILSPVGQCKPFDSEANGTVLGEGAGVVLLKRLNDAIRDHDNILAVIKATAINNDGANKVGYMAPSVEGQYNVIRKTQQLANIQPESISYFETHGTGTKMGDPIEMSALKKVFGEATTKYCALGAVKANIGHLDAAAGIAGLIKVVKALKNKQIPPLANYNNINPELDIENSPFYIPTTLKTWEKGGDSLRRAAVSSFGIGGTNAHCIVEEWDGIPEVIQPVCFQFFPLSAKTSNSLTKIAQKFDEIYLKGKDPFTHVAFSLQEGRQEYKFRQVRFGKSYNDLLNCSPVIGKKSLESSQTVFMFTGQGSQYFKMGKELYDNFEIFRQVIDQASQLLYDKFGYHLMDILYESADSSAINDTAYAQPIIVAVQYGIYKLLLANGISPDILIGHSIGELTAACVSGVFSFEDIIILAATRGALMQKQARGSMLSVNLSESELIKYLKDDLEIALINGPNFCVVSGSSVSIESFKKYLDDLFPDLQSTILKTSHAFHSYMMEPAVESFKNEVEKINRHSINIPFISNTTGKLATNEEAMSADYWGGHIRKAVNFYGGVSSLLTQECIFIEIGPGNMLTSLLGQFNEKGRFKSIPTMRPAKKTENDVVFFMSAIASYWVEGGNIDWSKMQPEKAYRVSLPTYAFEHKRHYIDTKQVFSFDFKHEINVENEYDAHSAATIDSIENQRSGFDANYVAPTTDLQVELIKLWEKFLGLPGIGIDDDFFSMGGHSLLASQIINRINTTYHVNLPLESLFNYSTIEKLDNLLKNEVVLKANVVKLEKVDGDNNLPVSLDQTRLWIISQIDRNPAYNIPFTYKISGHLNVSVFQRSLNEIFNRHAILRGKIEMLSIYPSLALFPKDQLMINSLDFSQFNDQVKLEKVNAFIVKDIRTVFDIGNDPLYRLYLIKISEHEFIFHLTIHHICFDGWSWGIFVNELNHIYAELIQDHPITLKQPEFQYYEFAQWQKNRPVDGLYTNSINYWKQKLYGHKAQLDFPYDLKRKERGSGLGCRVHFIVPRELSDRLKLLIKKENVTEFNSYLAVFSILLQKYTGQTDMCIGIPTANRANALFEEIIGFFVNTLVLRLEIDPEKSFYEYLAQSRTVIVEALEHQDLPFEKLVEAVQPQRLVNINPIYQFLFTWLSAPKPPIVLPDTIVERYHIPEGVSPLDLTLYMWDDAGVIEGEFEYSEDLFIPESITRLKDNYLALLAAIVEHPDMPIKSQSCISSTEIALLNKFNDTAVSVSSKAVHELFAAQAIVSNDKIALVFDHQTTSYLELEHASNRFANFLIQQGVHYHDIVGVCVNRSTMLVEYVLGVLKAGASYLPLDPGFPAERLNYMLSDAGAKLVITEEDLSVIFQGSKSNIICCDKLVVEIAAQSDIAPQITVIPDDLAYLIYTSGSTGKPKGVRVHHGAVVNFLESMTHQPGFASEDTLLAVTTMSFDISVLEVFLPLINGGTIVLAKRSEAINYSSLVKLMNDNNVTVLQATPATWNILVQNEWQGKSNLKALCGGEAISANLIEALLPKVKSLWNMYGPTETTVWSTCLRLQSAELPIYVGKPINNTRIYILSKENSLLPCGSVGEICIGGEGVSKGYHLRPELTNEKFIRIDGNELVYKTGDVGRIDRALQLEILGRIDNQIKLRGFRIEPGEIEVILCQFKGVKEAVVKVHKFSEFDERLVAFLNTDETFELVSEEIMAALNTYLPSYMVPSAYQISNEFPLTPNGKIDKKALAFKLVEIIPVKSEIKLALLPEREIESLIINTWQEFLNMSGISVNHNFFSIGGNSITLVQMSSIINTKLNLDIDIVHYFENPTIRTFCDFLIHQGKDREHAISPDETKMNRFNKIGQQRRKNNN